MKKFKTEAHAHVLPASKCSQISEEELGRYYADVGFDTVVLTNHFYIGSGCVNADDYLKCYYNTKKHAEKYGVNIVLGMEVRFVNDENPINDYLVYGVDEDDALKVEKLLEGTYNDFYEKFKNDKNVIVQAQPYRANMVLADINHLDGFELFNVHPNHAWYVGKALMLAKENKKLIVTGGTDFHHPGHEGLCATLTNEKITDSFKFAEALKSGNYGFQIGDFKIESIK